MRASADPVFRERAHWSDLIASRVEALSRMCELDFDMRLELIGVAEWTPETGATAEEKRRTLTGSQSDGNWVFLGFTGAETGAAEPGRVVPFDNRVLIFDYPAKSETENVANLVHEVGHLFGAWHSSDEKSIMHLPPGSQFDRAAVECIRLTRSMDMRRSVRDLSSATLDQLGKLWSDSKLPAGANPQCQFYAASGRELMSLGYPRYAVEPLTRAADMAPGEVRTHYSLAAVYLVLRNYHAAAGELRRVAEIDAQSAPALNSLAAVLAQPRQPGEAVASPLKTVELSAGSGALHANLGMELAGIAGHLDEGIDELRQALRMAPNDESVKAALDVALAAKNRGRQ